MCGPSAWRLRLGPFSLPLGWRGEKVWRPVNLNFLETVHTDFFFVSGISKWDRRRRLLVHASFSVCITYIALSVSINCCTSSGYETKSLETTEQTFLLRSEQNYMKRGRGNTKYQATVRWAVLRRTHLTALGCSIHQKILNRSPPG